MTGIETPHEPNQTAQPRKWQRSRRSGRGRSIPFDRKPSATYAALDLGTNNCRLLVAKPSRNGLRVVDAFSRIVRLGEGLGSSDRLCDDAVHRTLQALKICKEKIEANGVTRSRLIATEACRGAINGMEFVGQVKDHLGLDLEIVDRQAEAFLAVAGCASLVDGRARSCIVFDIGGGSTEIAWLDGYKAGNQVDPNAHIRAWDSLDAGVVTLAERYGGHDVSNGQYEAMVAEIMQKLSGFAAEAQDAEKAPFFHLLGTSGTVTTLGGIYLGLEKYDRRRVDGLWMSSRDMSDITQRLQSMSYAERAANACIGQERADLVLAGCAILDAIRKTFPTPFLRIADRGLREGILMKMMREDGVWRQGVRS